MSQNGKGSGKRKQTPEEARRFAREFDRIFRRQKTPKRGAKA